MHVTIIMPPRIQCVLFNKNASVGLIMLIEISSRACTTLDNINCCADIVVHPRIEMCSMLKYLKSPSMFKHDDRNVILKKFWDMTKTGANKNMTKVDYHMMSINIMINNKLGKY